MEVYAKFAAPTFAGGASKKGCPHGEHTNPWGRRKEVNIGVVGMGLIGSAPQKP
jgi:hypothetical protein